MQTVNSPQFVFCLLLAFAAESVAESATPGGVAAETMFDDPGTVWTLTPDAFVRTYRAAGYRFESNTRKDSARSYRGPLHVFGYPVVESIARFRDNKLDEIMFITYSRGDLGELNYAAFEKQLKGLQEALVAWTGQRPSPVHLDSATSGVKRAAKAWLKKPHQAKLEWSYSSGSRAGGRKVRPEYIRVFVRRWDKQHNYRSRIHAAKARRGSLVSRSALKSHVKRKPNGDVYIEGIPMVDQGAKGYCVVAASERIMRHYGRGVDQHELAQLARSSAAQGTDPRTMIAVLRKLSIDLGCKVRVHDDFDVNSFIRLIKRYNRVAKKKKASTIEIGQRIDLGVVYNQMEPANLKAARLGQKTNYKNFQKIVKTYIDQGMPILWSVMLGKIEEKGLPVRGASGHMRMIIGYNQKENRTIFSDTWGCGHELKVMPTEDAWTITTGFYTIEPRRMSI